jgi:hypothetical protein
MSPPNVYELTIPSSHIIKRITRSVQTISFSFLYQLSYLMQTILLTHSAQSLNRHTRHAALLKKDNATS